MSHAISAARRVVDYARADAREIKRLRKEVAMLKTQQPKREQYAQRTGPELAQAVEDAMGAEDFARLRDYLVAQDRIQQQQQQRESEATR